MCSRYFLDADGNIIAYTFRVPVNDKVKRRFNIAPTQDAPVVRVDREGNREVALLRWGLVPFWAKDLKAGNRMINARCEGVAEKPAFREALQRRRCIVPASGFFEWKEVGRRKQPFAITLPEAPLFGFAGLWERWRARKEPAEAQASHAQPGGDYVETFTIVTTEANEAVAAIHDRMPVIIPQAAIETWLAGPAEEAAKLLTPWRGAMTMRPVRQVVSDPRMDVPECLEDEPSWEDPQRSLL
ncbi:MAG TPA: SOS response-associated peptidase [Usitatibacter sp.]|nr:SOS response-associated peptidase [Usitatibacter sp.]